MARSKNMPNNNRHEQPKSLWICTVTTITGTDAPMASSQRTIDLHALRRIASQPKITVGAMIAPATKKSGNIPKKPNTRTKHTNQSDDPLT